MAPGPRLYLTVDEPTTDASATILVAVGLLLLIGAAVLARLGRKTA